MNHFLKILKVANRSQRIIWVGLVMAVLSACGTVTPTVDANDSDRFDLITRITIDDATSEAELEAASGGRVIVFRPEAGFAIVAFHRGQGDIALMNTADPNQDVFGTPEASASGWTAWSGGWTAWSGGWTAWSGGWTAWSGGWTAWSGGASGSSTLSENLLPWDQINLPEGQLLAPNLGNGIKVAVIDTGVDLGHPAFAGRLAAASEWRDYLDNDDYPADQDSGNASGHGTSVAGIVLQVAPNATILPLRVLENDGSGDVDHVVAAIDHAISMGCDVINLSLGTDVDVAALRAMMDYAASQQVFVIASVGNSGSSAIEYPARYAKELVAGSYLVSVGAVDSSDIKTSFSNYGGAAELFAPGSEIYTTSSGVSGPGISHTTGTSFAAPMVTGAIALALGEGPSAALVATLAGAVNSAAQDIESSNPQFVGQVGFGRLDIEAFLSQMGYVAPAPTRSALLVANLSPSTSTVFIEERLELLGFNVTLIDDGDASAADASGKDLIVISHTVSSGTINSKFRDVAVPVITWEDGIFDDMNMASSKGDVDNVTDLSIVTTHPLAAGFSGDIQVYEDDDRLAWGTPSSSAITVATVPGYASKAVIFAYEAGAQMVGMTAPAKRVGFFFQNYDVDKYGFRGVALFDAAVMWSTMDTSTPPASSVSTYIQAEAASSVEGAFAAAADGSVSGGSYMTIPQGTGQDYDGDESPMGRLHFDLNDVPSDTYYVWMRVFGPDSGSNSFFVRMDNGAKDDVHYDALNDWLWHKVPGSFALGGDHTLTVMLREDGARIDELLITDDAGFTPSGMGSY